MSTTSIPTTVVRGVFRVSFSAPCQLFSLKVYTNVVAKITLDFASDVGALLNKTTPSTWRDISAKLVIPVDDALNIHLEFDEYNGTIVPEVNDTRPDYVIKQVLLLVLQHPCLLC